MHQVQEVTYGVTPATPALERIRHTGTTLALTKDSSQSEEIREDRQISCYRHGMRQVGGDISVEFASSDFDTMLEAALCGTWDATTTDELTSGTVRRSFSILRNFSDQQSADKPYHLFTGCEYNTWSMTVSPNSIVTSEFTVIGQNLSLDTAEPTGATYPPVTGECPFDGFSGTIKEGGTDIGIVTEVSLTLENGYETKPVVGSDLTLQPTIGKSDLTGQITVYFEDATLLEKFISESSTSLEFSLANAAGDSYTFFLPNIIYSGGSPDVSGEGTITLAMPFQALFDDVEGASIKINRVIA